MPSRVLVECRGAWPSASAALHRTPPIHAHPMRHAPHAVLPPSTPEQAQPLPAPSTSALRARAARGALQPKCGGARLPVARARRVALRRA